MHHQAYVGIEWAIDCALAAVIVVIVAIAAAASPPGAKPTSIVMLVNNKIIDRWFSTSPSGGQTNFVLCIMAHTNSPDEFSER